MKLLQFKFLLQLSVKFDTIYIQFLIRKYYVQH